MNIDKELQNSKYLNQMFAELIVSQREGVALIVAAMARQMDAQQLADNLRSQIKSAQAVGHCPTAAIDLATHALAALEAETAFQDKNRH